MSQNERQYVDRETQAHARECGRRRRRGVHNEDEKKEKTEARENKETT